MKRTAFTLMELIIVVVILGVVAGFAIPAFTRAVEKARVKRGRLYLTAIHAASTIYKAKHSVYPNIQCGAYNPPYYSENKACLQLINTTLGINLPYDPDLTFLYNYGNDGNFPQTFTADIERGWPCWVLRISSEAPISNTNPWCQITESTYCP